MASNLLVRVLCVQYILLGVATKISQYYTTIPEEATTYNETLSALFDNPFGQIHWVLLGAFGYVMQILGLVVLFFGRRAGSYWLLGGTALSVAISVLLSNPNSYPFLETTLTSLLFGGACATWGALVVVSLKL